MENLIRGVGLLEQPSFGEKVVDKEYKMRYGAYVVIPRNNNQEVILVQAPNGAYFLPGGEIEAGEDHYQAIDREMLEEVGYQVKVANFLGEAVDYFYSRHRDTYYHHPAYFYAVTDWEKVAEPTEKTNQLAWMTPADAIVALKRGSHKWAVGTWLASLS